MEDDNLDVILSQALDLAEEEGHDWQNAQSDLSLTQAVEKIEKDLCKC